MIRMIGYDLNVLSHSQQTFGAVVGIFKNIDDPNVLFHRNITYSVVACFLERKLCVFKSGKNII